MNMKKLTNLPLGSREEYFLSDIYSKGKLLAQGIKSKLILNDIKYSRAFLLLYLPEENFRGIRIHFELEIKGYFENVEREKIGEIHIPKGYMINSTTFSSSWNECVVEIVPDEIYQKHCFSGQKEAKKEKQNIFFILTDNTMAKPFGKIETSFTGEIKTVLEPTVILKFKDDWNATFEEHHHYADTKIEDVDGAFSTSHLVLNLEKNNCCLNSINEVKILSDLLDKLLWYLSFGSRQRTTWVKWTAEIGTELVKHYRNNILIPEQIKYYEEPLIDRRAFQDFLQHCLEYEKQQNNLDLYLPIVYLVSSGNPTKTVEMQFLSSFLALEALLDLYAENRNKNKLFTKESWKTFRDYIKKSIEEFSGFNDDIFCVDEFKLPLSIEKLCRVINNENYNIPLNAPNNTLDWLNELLKMPNFYDILKAKKPNMSFSNIKITESVDKTKDYRNKSFSNLNNSEQSNIKRLNRLLLEENYSQETPKDHFKNLMIEKIGDFNRTSRKKVYNDFCKDMEIDNSDLWPTYGTRFNYLSLIRNKLVHGKRFEYEAFLSIANEHLRWTVERCLLAILGWKGITDVKPESLRKYTAYHDWESYYKKE